MSRIARAAVQLSVKNPGYRRILNRRYSETAPAPDVPGLSKKTVDVPSSEVGFPGASKHSTYKNPEYFCYTNMSYFEAEVEMTKYRLPQPSNKAKK